MRYHIVRTTDTIERIANVYNMTIYEIKTNNTHISDWRHLIPGTKIMLPAIPDYVKDELDDTEPFIEDYYPKINHQIEIKKEEIEEEKNNDIEEEPKVEINENKGYSYYYPPYYFLPSRPIKKIRGRG